MFKVTIIWRHESCNHPSSLINRYATKEMAIKETAQQVKEEWLDADMPGWDMPDPEEWPDDIEEDLASLRSLWDNDDHEAFIEAAEVLYTRHDYGELWVEITEEN